VVADDRVTLWALVKVPPPGLAEGVATVKVYVADVTVLSTIPLLVAMALRVVLLLAMVSGPL
jgi:hypothetical protein